MLLYSTFAIYGPNLKKKAILSRDLQFMKFALLQPSQNAIGSPYNASESKQFLPLGYVYH